MGDQGPIIIWLNAVLMALTLTAISSRVGRRVFLIGTWSWHDLLVTVAAICALVFSICQMVGTTFGLGKHQEDVPVDEMPRLIKLIIASNVFYFTCNWVVKHALLLFYADIVREKKYRGSIYFMHFVAFGFGLSSILVNLFQCTPFRKAYHSNISGHCVNLNIFFYCNASIMLATDLVLYAMPVVFTWNLQLRRPQRIGLNCLFALGGLVLAASAARMEAVYKFATEPDFPWWFANAMIWSVLENHLAIVVACAPSIKVIALLVFPRLKSSYRKVVSKVTPSNSRSRSRASGPYDLESGTRKSDQLKPTPSGTPLPSPALTYGSGGSRASKNFARWFKGPMSPRHLDRSDSMDHGLVYVEDPHVSQSRDVHMVNISRDSENDKRWKEERENGRGCASPSGENDIRVERTIRVESSRDSSGDEITVLGRAA
ncbi:uncharacterized protein BDR25DRAFT_292866 [Lindgomyces ingoldianus]|uniref:Uncharacterized protein n=1 Tax=Lindgomyces ingoldianus TaxID=673940 RepID=A0ACB6QJG6_9PLEO|nr:uncharacterized protein BDR25DRAFT_292866 [Lindgomyces ingoldianus]KAF2467071.1 hypothetical protein BDR25DRAFT_292866 [Lindgomyces ingoldianus]